MSDARAKTRAACEDPEQASLDTLQAVADCVDSSETDKAASACFTEKVEAIHKACTDD